MLMVSASGTAVVVEYNREEGFVHARRTTALAGDRAEHGVRSP
jgi:hypothetical protein